MPREEFCLDLLLSNKVPLSEPGFPDRFSPDSPDLIINHHNDNRRDTRKAHQKITDGSWYVQDRIQEAEFRVSTLIQSKSPSNRMTLTTNVTVCWSAPEMRRHMKQHWCLNTIKETCYPISSEGSAIIRAKSGLIQCGLHHVTSPAAVGAVISRDSPLIAMSSMLTASYKSTKIRDNSSLVKGYEHSVPAFPRVRK